MLGKRFGLIRVFDFWNSTPETLTCSSGSSPTGGWSWSLTSPPGTARRGRSSSGKRSPDPTGDGHVDLFAPDRYNWWTYKPGGKTDKPVWETFSTLFQDIVSVARSHGKRVVIGEFASHPSVDSAERSRPGWLSEAAAFMKANPEIVGYCYYHSLHEKTGNDWRLTEADKTGYAAFANARG